MKVIALDNIDKVMRELTKIGKGNGQEVIVEARKGLRKVANSFVPAFKGATPTVSGDLQRSVKVKSSTKRGVTSVKVIWDQPEGQRYGSFMNFNKGADNYRKISNLYKAYKWRMDQASQEAIRLAMKKVFEQHGFTVK